MELIDWKPGSLICPHQTPEIWEHFGHEFFHAFSHLPQTLLREIWKFDDEDQQIYLKTPLEDDFIFPWVHQRKILGYLAGEMDTDTHFSQYRYFEFKRPDGLPKTFEILSLFRTREESEGIVNLKKDFLQGQVGPALLDLGFECVLATCTDQMLPFYLRWGAEVIDQHDFHGFNRYLLLGDIRKFLGH